MAGELSYEPSGGERIDQPPCVAVRQPQRPGDIAGGHHRPRCQHCDQGVGPPARFQATKEPSSVTAIHSYLKRGIGHRLRNGFALT